MARKHSIRPPSARASRHQLVQAQRVRLFEAYAIVQVTRHATASKLAGLDEISISNALQAAARIIDDVACALEIITTRRPQ